MQVHWPFSTNITTAAQIGIFSNCYPTVQASIWRVKADGAGKGEHAHRWSAVQPCPSSGHPASCAHPFHPAGIVPLQASCVYPVRTATDAEYAQMQLVGVAPPAVYAFAGCMRSASAGAGAMRAEVNTVCLHGATARPSVPMHGQASQHDTTHPAHPMPRCMTHIQACRCLKNMSPP